MGDYNDDFDFVLPEDDANKRGAFRAQVAGLKARISGSSRDFPVRDVSAAGCALHDETGRRFRQGDVFELEIRLNDKPLLTQAAVTVKRVLDNGLIGCSFVGLSSRQEALLDKLVLEVQKRMIALKKAKDKK